MTSARPSRSDAEERYRDRRLAALYRAEEIASEAFAPTPIRLDVITSTALQIFEDQWKPHPARRYAWPWPDMVEDFRRNEPDRFELSVWSGDTLCGLAIGRTRRTFCRVDYLEGSPDPNHPLKGGVVVVASGAVVAYATAIGREEVRLSDPISALVPRYEELGFSLASPKGQATILLVEDQMKPRALRTQVSARSALKAEPKAAAKRATGLPSMAPVKKKLAALSAEHMPWLRKGAGLTPPDGGQEVCGPSVYRAPKKRG